MARSFINLKDFDHKALLKNIGQVKEKKNVTFEISCETKDVHAVARFAQILGNYAQKSAKLKYLG